MTIDIIAAAQADRQIKLDQILALQLDVIEIDAFIAKARAYAGEGGCEPEEITSQANVDGAFEVETPSEEINPAQPEIRTIPLATEGEQSVAVPEIDPALKGKLFTAPIREDRIERDREVIERRRRLGLV